MFKSIHYGVHEMTALELLANMAVIALYVIVYGLLPIVALLRLRYYSVNPITTFLWAIVTLVVPIIGPLAVMLIFSHRQRAGKHGKSKRKPLFE